MGLTRRSLVAAAAVAPVVLALSRVSPAWASDPPQPVIRPRADWAGDLAPVGPLQDEEDVRFLLIHHTATPTTRSPEEVPERLRSIFRFHTSSERGWADVAYNFFVDPEGTVWEGRAGSIERPIRGDATGGSQGHALLCCFLGDFTSTAPSEAAMAAMTGLVAWLAGRHRLDLEGPVTFTSRGSTRWPTGVQVTTPQVAGHRDMSHTDCPGDALYPLIAAEIMPQARALLRGPTPTPVPETPTPPPPRPSVTPGTTPSPSAADPAGDATARLVGAGLLAAGVTGAVLVSRGRRSEQAQQFGDDDGAADGQGGEQAEEEPDGRA